MNKCKEIVLIALLSAILVISKELLAFLPNIELVTFLLIMYSKHFKLENSLMIANVFCLLQMVLYGIGEWTPIYFFVWNGLVFISYHFKRLKRDSYALLAACFGLTFGFFFALPYLFFSLESMLAYWIKGLFFDLIHGIGNYLMVMILYDATDSWMNRYMKGQL